MEIGFRDDNGAAKSFPVTLLLPEPTTMRSIAFLSLFLCGITAAPSAPADILVRSDFPGGSAKVISVDSATQTIEIEPKTLPGRGFPCWWYMRISGLNHEQPLTVKVRSSKQPFQGQHILGGQWAIPDQIAYSSKQGQWQQTSPGKITAGHGTWMIPAGADAVEAAWGPPFLQQHADMIIRDIVQSDDNCSGFELARTRGGHAVPAIRFGPDPLQQPERPCLWIQARQHAWEAGSSWVAAGLMRWLANDSPAAVRLRERTTVFVVPIMDIDSVQDGCGGKGSIPRDHNRDWSAMPIYPEVAAAQKRLIDLADREQLKVFIDLHNPAPGDRRPFFFGPGIEQLKPQEQQRYNRWLIGAVAAIDQLDPKYHFTSYISTTEEQNRVSSTWVRNHCGNDVLSATLETAWNRPQGTAEGYQQVGEQLGEALDRFIASPPPVR